MEATSIKNDILSYSVDQDGIALITIDMVNHPANLFNNDFFPAYFEAASAAIKDSAVKGVIVTSARRMFMAGGDLRFLARPLENPEEFFNGAMEMHRGFRELETSGKPFVAAINGTALGGGLELALTCHHRICLNHSKIKIGFPEVKVGLFPGGGGTSKAPYLMGLQNGLTYLLQGIEARPPKALKDKLIDAVVESTEELIPAAKAWILANPNPVQAWDNKKHRIPGGGLMTPNGAQIMAGGIGNLRKMTHGNYPGANFVMSVVYEGMQMPIDRALEVEARYFTKVLQTKEARNMIRTGFFAIGEARKGKVKPQGYDKFEVGKLGILGAGMMGAGIAYVSALSGMDVVLKDVSMEGAEKGKEYSRGLLKKRISKGRTSQEKADAVLEKITPTDDPSAVEGCDLVIEAVFENPDLKATVTKQTEAVLGEDKIYASNTSTIPITQLAKASERPENFIGLHFFSPVDKMPLVEIIVGEKTSDRTIAAGVDYVTAIRKVPIVVNDSRGFFTSRVFGTFTGEGLFLLEEGVPAAMIENITRTKGMPVGPLAVSDEVSLTLGIHVMESDPRLQEIPDMQRIYKLQKMLVEEHGRKGKKEGAGFYEYPQGGKKFLWPKLSEIFNSNPDTLDKETIAKRILHRQALESYRCLDEGVLRSAKDGDIGSILGWGFPIYTGGAISYIQYVGMKQFVAECDELRDRFGVRFTVPDSLREMAESGKTFYE
ncbi:MAG: 3-hydroxyacyl-CoA dehydrogenase NAD-binding domain-containing protein [Bacteroidota bacterium]